MRRGVPRWDCTWRRRSWWWRCRYTGSGSRGACWWSRLVRWLRRPSSGTFRSVPISILTRSLFRIIFLIIFRQRCSIRRRWRPVDPRSNRHSFWGRGWDPRSISRFLFLGLCLCCCAWSLSIFGKLDWVFPRFCVNYFVRCPGCRWGRFGRLVFDRSFKVRVGLLPNIFQNFVRWNFF